MRNKKNILILSPFLLLLLLVFFSCEPKYDWTQINELDTGAYFTSQSTGYLCGFVSICTWLKWCNKTPFNINERVLENWFNANGYGNLVKNDWMTCFQLQDIMNKSGNDLVDWYNRIKVKARSFDNNNNFFKDLRDSVGVLKQPVVLRVAHYENLEKGGHFMLTYGFVCNKNDVWDYAAYMTFAVIDGNNTKTSGKRVLSREELINSWNSTNYICDERSLGYLSTY